MWQRCSSLQDCGYLVRLFLSKPSVAVQTVAWNCKCFCYRVCSFPTIHLPTASSRFPGCSQDDVCLTNTYQMLQLEKDTRKSFVNICKVKPETYRANAFVKLQRHFQHTTQISGAGAEWSPLRYSAEAPSQSRRVPLPDVIPFSTAPLEAGAPQQDK